MDRLMVGFAAVYIIVALILILGLGYALDHPTVLWHIISVIAAGGG